MSMLGMLLGNQPGGSAAPPVPAPETPFAAHTRARPTGRKPLPEKLPRQRLRRDWFRAERDGDGWSAERV